MEYDEAYYQRRSDARTLAAAEEIKADKERFINAQQGAREIYKEEQARFKGIAKVANKKTKINNLPEATDNGNVFTPKKSCINKATIGRLYVPEGMR